MAIFNRTETITCLLCVLGVTFSLFVRVSFGDCSSNTYSTTSGAIKETEQDVILWNETFSIPNIILSMEPATTGVDPSAVDDLNEYINLNYSDSFLEIRVVKALDREELFTRFHVNIESITLQMFCKTQGTQVVRTNLTLFIQDVNEFAPYIHGIPYNIAVKEDTPIGSTVFKVNITDPDVPSTPLIYTLKSTDPSSLGAQYFGFSQPSFPNLKLIKPVDYDALVSSGKEPIFHFLLNVTDASSSGLSNNTNVTVVVQDVDDLPPIFIYPDCEQQCASTQFRISTTRTKRGQLVVSPIELKAIDQDSLNFSVTYSIEPDQNNYHDSFKIDNITASISQIADINHTGIILVKATEKSAKRHYTTAVVLVELPNDPLNKPERSTDEADDNGTLIGIIVLAIVSAALISVVVVLVILHRKLKKNVAPFDGNSSVIKVLDEKGQKSSEINEVKPIPRSNTISQKIELPDNVRQENVKDIKEYDEETDHNLEMQNGNLLNALSTTSEKNNTLDPIQPNTTPKKKKKKKKKSKSLSEKLGKKNRSGISEVGQGNNEDERTQSSREDRTLDLQNTEIAAIDGEFV